MINFYGKVNYEPGFELFLCFPALFRHICAFNPGETGQAGVTSSGVSIFAADVDPPSVFAAVNILMSALSIAISGPHAYDNAHIRLSSPEHFADELKVKIL